MIVRKGIMRIIIEIIAYVYYASMVILSSSSNESKG